MSSSAGLSIEAKKKLFEQSNFEFYEMYGATEVATATNQDRFLASKSIESVGKPCPGVEIAIFDENFKKCGEGEIGEICVKSPLTSPGYLNSTEKTALSFQYGFFRTGDLGFLDKENFLYLRGRKADLIISGGLNIFPQDIEEAIATYPAALEVEVVGQPDVYLGEVAVAVIATESPANEIEPKIRKLLRSKLASYQQPTRYIFLDRLPYQANGKRDKVAIKRLVLSEN